MKVLIFQHTPEEAPGTLLQWLELRNLERHVHHWYLNLPAPELRAFDWLVILGGPMNLDQETEHPWLKEEKRALRSWLETGKPVLGICLGGQLLAQSLGGTVTRNPKREIGFHEVRKVGVEHPALRRWPEKISVYQYHEDTFSLPAGCVNLLSSEACGRQAFAKGHRLLGLQFHPESTAEWIRLNAASVAGAQDENFVQHPEDTEKLAATNLTPMTESFFRLLDDFVEAWR